MNHPIRILLVDDSPYFLDAARGYLEVQESIQVAGAATGAEEAVALAREAQPDVILLDLNLAHSSGLELIPVFKKDLPDAKIVVLTMMEGDAYRAAALQAGADDFVAKNDMGRKLMSIIYRLMERREPAKGNAADGETGPQAARSVTPFLRLAERLPDLIYRFEFVPQRGFTYVSPSATAMTGYTSQEYYADPDLGFKLVHPDDRHILGAAVQEKTDPLQPLQLRWMKKDGTILWTEQRSVSIYDAEGKLIAIEGIARDITERKQMEDALRETEEKYRSILEDITELIIRFLPDGTLTYVNDAYCRYFGKSREELIGSNFIAGGADDFPQRLREYFQTFTPDHPTSAFEQYDILPNGEKRWREWIDRAIFDERGVLIEFQSTGRDITERKRAEEELRAREAQLSGLVQSTMDAILVIDEEQRILLFNPAAEAVFRCPASEALGSSLERFIPEYAREKHRGYVRAFGNSKQTRRSMKAPTLELTCLRADGTSFPSEISISQFEIEGRKRFIASVRDITERKRAEERIQNQLNRLNALREIDRAIASTFDLRVSLDVLLSQTIKLLSVDAAAILLVDASTDVLNFEAGIGFRNAAPRTANIKLGESYAGKVVLEQRLVRIPNLADDPRNPLLTAYLKGEDFVGYHGMPLIVKGKVLGVLEVFNRSAVKHDDEWYDTFGTLAGQAAIAVDNARLFSASQRELMERRRAEQKLQKLNAELEERVEKRTTDLKRLNLELERALRVKDEFLANMSHELRTPLNAIIGLSESLAERTVGELNEKQAKYVEVIGESGQHLLELINDILDLAKIESGQIGLDRSQVNVSEVCHSALRMIHQLAKKKDQEVSFEMDADLNLIRADERRLKQMLVNLLSNAVKFTPEGGRIGLEVRGNRRENIVQFAVWDTGIGIKEEELARLFRPFIQLDSELSRKNTGTGLGLALVAQMARLHGGGVNVESQPGKGSRFIITLPWEPAAVTGVPPRRITYRLGAGKPGTEHTKRTILLVEDTEDVIVLIGDYLEYAGYKVEVASNGLDGIAQAKKVRPDLILMDIQMPGMDGLEATRRLRTEDGLERIPIIALTALAMPGDRERALAAGMDEYISKPVNLKSMLKIIHRFLAGDEESAE